MSELDPNAIAAIPDFTGNNNRGNDVEIKSTDAPAIRINLEFINTIVMDYFQNKMAPMVNDNDNRVSVPVLYGTPERWSTIRREGVLRDVDNSKLLTPLIMLRRSSIKEAQPINPNNKYLYISIGGGWNPRSAYDKFAILNNIRPSQQVRQVVVPDYVDLTYDIVMWTEYQTQMDLLVEQMIFEGHEYAGTRNNFKFQLKIDSFEARSELPASQDRVVRTEFQATVHAYLIPDRVVRNAKLMSSNVETYTAKKIVAFTEAVVSMDDLKNTEQ